MLCSASSMFALQRFEPVDLARERGGDRRLGRVAALRDLRRRAGGVGMHDRLEAELADRLAALASAWMWLCTVRMVFERGALGRQQMVLHALEMLADDVEAGIGHQPVDVGDAAGDRVLDRDHGVARAALAHRVERVLERRGRQRRRRAARPGGRRGRNRRRAGPGRRWCARGRASSPSGLYRRESACGRARRSSGVLISYSTRSINAASMRMPASSARSCSSFSRARARLAATSRNGRAPRAGRHRARSDGKAAPRPTARRRG